MLLLMRRDIRLLLDDDWLIRSPSDSMSPVSIRHRTPPCGLEADLAPASRRPGRLTKTGGPEAARVRRSSRSLDGSTELPCLPQQRQDALRRLVGLREHARAGLLQDLVLGELDHLGSHVHVADTALGGHQVLLVGGQVAQRVLEAVLDRTERATEARDVLDRLVDRGDRGRVDRNRADGRLEVLRVDRDRAVGVVGAHLEGDRRGRVQQLDAVELSARADALDFAHELLRLGGDGRLVAGAERAGLVLHGQLTDALQHGVDLVEGALRSLHEADRVLRVALRLRQTTDLATQLLADRQPGSVVGRTIDARTGAQALHRLLHVRARRLKLTVSVERLDVVVDAKGHSVFSLMTIGWSGPE